jgi:Uma2 family endonuclease
MHDRLIAEPIRLTYEDFCALPDDGKRYEILDGDLYVSPSPFTAHQAVVGNLFVMLTDYVRSRKLGRVFVAPYDVVLDRHDVVEPDLIYVSKANATIITHKNIQGSPDLLVEVLSDSTRERDTRDKRNIYARCGVPWYWIVDPEGPRVMELKLLERAYAVVADLSGEAVWTPALFPESTIRLPELIAE